MAPNSDKRKMKQYQCGNGNLEFHARLPAQVPAISRWHLKTGAYRTQSQAKKTGKIEEDVARMQVLHTVWRQKRQWCPGGQKHVAASYAWYNDVKASMFKDWQIAPICSLLVVSPS